MPGGPETATLSATGEPAGVDRAAGAPHLFLVLEAHRPLAPPVRLALADVDEVVVGRGAARAVGLAVERGVRRLHVQVEDRRLSSSHARIARVLRRWALEDTGSKNGSFVNGAREAHAELADGDVIELGQTLFVFRDTVAGEPSAPAILDASTLRPPASGLATLLPSLARDVDRIASLAPSTIPIVLQGETGTGKEVMARAIHAMSRRTGDFVAVNCGALPRDLVEAELFGHRKGAFSGAAEERPGLVRSADRGTLLLDEIGDLPAPAQAALLRVLQEREVRPIGGTRAIPVDLRVIAATHRPLDRMVSAGEFRADLFARLAGHVIELCPLRSRREDLGILLGAILPHVAPGGAAGVTLHPSAARALLCHDWPGNVRELEQCLRTASVLARGGRIEVEHLPPAVRRADERAATSRAAAEEARREQLAALLREHEGNVSAVARAMGKARIQVQRWMKRYGIDPESFRR
ncbi:MAG: sigma 54-interacting transcriptional regulator [Minicystis sp.]